MQISMDDYPGGSTSWHKAGRSSSLAEGFPFLPANAEVGQFNQVFDIFPVGILGQHQDGGGSSGLPEREAGLWGFPLPPHPPQSRAPLAFNP